MNDQILEKFVAQNPYSRAALDDLTIESGRHPDYLTGGHEGPQEAWFLKNNNSNSPIVASMEAVAPDNFVLETPNRMSARNYFPISNEIRIGPGGLVLLGRKQILVRKRVHPGVNPPPPGDRILIAQTFRKTGAYYNDDLPPQHHEQGEDYTWIYSVPSIGPENFTSFDVVVNTHKNRKLDILMEPSGGAIAPYPHQIVLLPEESNWFNYGTQPYRYRIIHAKLV